MCPASNPTRAVLIRAAVAFSLAPHRHSAVGAYSKGMRQGIVLIAALLHDPSLLILDEPLMAPEQSESDRPYIATIGIDDGWGEIP